MSGEPRTDLDPSLLISSLARDLPRLHQDNTFKDPWEEEEEETSRSSNEEIHALVDELVDSVLAEDEERLSRLGPTPPSFSPADLQARLKELTDRTLKRFPLADPTNRQLNLKRTCQLAISSRLWKAFRDRWKGMPEKENTYLTRPLTHRILRDLIQRYCSAKKVCLKFDISGPAPNQTHSILGIPENAPLPPWVRQHEASLPATYRYDKLHEAERVEVCNEFDHPLQQRLLDSSAPPLFSLNAPSLPLDRYPSDLQQSVSALSSDTRKVAATQAGNLNLLHLKHGFELENVRKILEFGTTESLDRIVATQGVCLVDGAVREFVVASSTFSPPPPRTSFKAHFDNVIKTLHPDWAESRLPPLQIQPNRQGGGLTYARLPTGSTSESKDGSMVLEVLPLASPEKIGGAFSGVYEITRPSRGIELRSLSSYLTYSPDDPLPVDDLLSFGRFAKRHISLRAGLQVRDQYSPGKFIFTANPRRVNFTSTSTAEWDPLLTLRIHHTVAERLRAQFHFLFFPDPRRQIIAALSGQTSDGKIWMCEDEAKHLVKKVMQEKKQSEGWVLETYSVKKDADKAVSAIEDDTHQLSERLRDEHHKPAVDTDPSFSKPPGW
ncbi:uncharacterized protein JCM6883_000191 [Sporobolomyces salmoneus]|uniref:uncharacterized protein n=1 Tax=Sporobolomyces salmoneus TaxID=183962 RepID=UPI00317C718A